MANKKEQIIKKLTEKDTQSVKKQMKSTSYWDKLKNRLIYSAIFTILLLITGLGVMAENGWLPHTDGLTGRKNGWFGRELEPLVSVIPTSTPQLAKEYIYAGSRLLAVEDAGAATAPLADLTVWRPSLGTWNVMGERTSKPPQWGVSGDVPTPGDYDGDGKSDFCVYRPSNRIWYPLYSSNNTSGEINFGAPGDKSAQADYDGDGKTDVAMFRPSNGTWYIWRSSDQGLTAQVFGLGTDTPTPADFDGDGKTDIAIWRDSAATFWILRSTNGQWQSQQFGQAGDKPVVGDYDGDGRADAAIWRGGVNQWQILSSATQTTKTVTFGDRSSDIEVQKDYDGDGKTDIAVWRPSTGIWYIAQSSQNGQLRQVQWGQPGDIPVPALYKR